MERHEFAERIYLNLGFEPTDQQVQVMAALADFCTRGHADGADRAFLLCGYAGTGKTSLTGALVRALGEAGIPAVLMAPTGRAAKVFSSFACTPASTIHRRIYRGDPGNPLGISREVADNPLEGGVFIVDEASMIGDDTDGYGRGNLLEDLLHYVFSGVDCKLILLGDTAQLPPVGCSVSPAMDLERLHSFGLKVSRAVMTDTVRQRKSSGILWNATRLRQAMRLDELPMPDIRLNGFSDIRGASAEDLPELLESDYSTLTPEQVLLVTRSNRRAVQFNLAIRNTILEREEELSVGERLLVAKNNYVWSAKVKGLDFIANGDIGEVLEIYGTEMKYGLRFADVKMKLPDRDVEFDCKVMLSTLTTEEAALGTETYNRLYSDIVNDPDLFSAGTPMSARAKIVRRDPYLNALQVKYAYAVTCHKAQGGQWASVYIDMGGIAPEALRTRDFYRWLYTALTRSTSRVTLINPPAHPDE